MIPRAFMPTPCWGFARTAKTSTYAVTAVDRGYTIDCTSGTFSVTLAAAATLGAGFSFAVYNSGSGVITIDPNGSETIRSSAGSATTLLLSQGQGVLLQCDGTGFEAVAGAGLPISDNLFRVVGSADATKQIAFEADTQTTGFTFTWDVGAQTGSRTLTVPVLSGADTIATLATAQTVTGAKTFSGITTVSNATAGGVGTGALVLSAGGASIAGAVYANNIVVQGTGNTQGGIWIGAADGLNLRAKTGSVYDMTFQNAAGTINVFSILTGSSDLYLGSTTDSTSTGTGSFITPGGIGVAKRLCLDGATGKTLRITNGVANAAVAVTLGAGPTGSTAGNPQGWMRIDINGTDRYIPYW